MLSQAIKIMNPTGLHLRPAGNLCKEAMKYKSKITFEYRGNTANAKSVLFTICIQCRGPTTPATPCDATGLGCSPFARHYWGNH